MDRRFVESQRASILSHFGSSFREDFTASDLFLGHLSRMPVRKAPRR
jgi:hypothetical protein